VPPMFDVSILIIWSLVGVLLVVALRKKDGSARRGLRRGVESFLINGPRVVVALLSAGFLAFLLPKELIATWLGNEAGFQGILIGCLVGPFFPGGPLVIFPVTVVLLKAGAGLPAVVAFLTAASTWGLHRILVFEIPMMGAQFAAIRFVSSLLLPPISGLVAAILVRYWGMPAVGG